MNPGENCNTWEEELKSRDTFVLCLLNKYIKEVHAAATRTMEIQAIPASCRVLRFV